MNSGRKRVLFILPSWIGGGGGAERVFSVLLQHLDRERFEPHLAAAQGRNAHLDDVPADVVVHELKVSRMRYALPAIIRIVRKIKPQTVLSTVVHLNVLLMLARPFLPRGTRLLLREGIIPSPFIAHDTGWPQLWAWFYRYLYKKADRIICLSDSMMNDFVDHFGLARQKLVRIYNPVDAEKVRNLADTQGNPYSGPGPHLVTVGRLQRQKGMDILLDAMPAVLAALPDARLTILGEGPLESELKEQAARLGLKGAVSFLGFQSNPWPYIKYAALFVLPSRFEGLPNTLLEVLALGKNVVVTDCPGGIQEIQDAVRSMILVPPENPEALAHAIIAALQKSIADDVKRFDQALGKFDLQNAVAAYTALL